jgi:PIN domain nuclease of toxin-antitoxin system
LLDKHTLIRLLFNTKNIPKSLLSKLENQENDLFVSAVSFWEIAIKFNLNKLKLGNLNPNELVNLCKEHQIKLIDLEAKHCSTFYLLDSYHHKDPFDRILIWQAIQHNLKFVTNDKNIKMYESIGLKTIW